MLWLITGLILFLGTHSVRIVAEDWRLAQISKRGEQIWQGIFSVIALLGFILIIWGYGEARAEAQMLWNPPVWTKHLASLINIPAFILLVAVYVPGTKIKASLGHPMILGVKLWAFAHLISNGSVADITLFGTFLLWAIFDFRSARRRKQSTENQSQFIAYSRDAIAAVIGLIIWAGFAFYLHEMWIGVYPFA